MGYLDEWEASVSAREGFTRSKKAMMTLSNETLEGLQLTGTNITMYLRQLSSPVENSNKSTFCGF